MHGTHVSANEVIRVLWANNVDVLSVDVEADLDKTSVLELLIYARYCKTHIWAGARNRAELGVVSSGCCALEVLEVDV